jgi:hypothetical protein
MSELHPLILGVVVVAAFVSLGVPRTMQDAAFAAKGGLAWTAIAAAMNAAFQWHDPSPLNLLLMNEKAGTFECILLSIGYAFILRAVVGSLSSLFRRMRGRH